MQYYLAASLLLIAAFLCGFSAYALIFRRDSAISVSLAVFMLTLSLYSGGYAGELLSVHLSSMIVWSTFQYVGISFMPYLWIMLTARYVNAPFLSNRALRVLLILASFITLFGSLTDPWLHLKYATVDIVRDMSFPVLSFTRGPLYFFHIFYSFSSFITGTILLLHALLSSGRLYRRQLLLMIAGSSIPWVNYTLYLTGFGIPGLDTIPFGLFISALCFGAAIFSARLLDVVPVARGLVFDMIQDPVVVLDPRDRVADFNQAALRLFPGLENQDRANPADSFALSGDIRISIDSGVDCDFQTSIKVSGEDREYSCRISVLRSLQGRAVARVMLLRDITESSRYLARLQELATIDPLTGVFNRRHFMEQAVRMVSFLERKGGQLSLIIADLDHFKAINDTFGHLTGDEILKSVAQVFASGIRGGDIAARFGGEEFICLLSDADVEAAFMIAERIREKITQITTQDGASTSASFGVASSRISKGKDTVKNLISRADAAMYRAKEQGRNKTVVDMQ